MAQPSNKMRSAHRNLGFFLAGIMAVYAISGITLIFRDADTFKKSYHIEKTIAAGVQQADLGKALDIRRLKVTKQEGDMMYFKEGTYNTKSGAADYTIKKVPLVLDKLQHLHKAKTADPLYFLNIFFGASLLFMVVSSFWMYTPSASVFKKGMIFTAAGILLTLILLFV